MKNKSFRVRKLTLSSLLLLFILNPYTIYGPLGLAVLPVIFVCFFSKYSRPSVDLVLICFALILISMIGVFSSYIHGIGQFLHFKVAASLAMYVLISHALFFLFLKDGFRFNDFLHCALLISVLNSLVVILEVFFPVFRQAVETFLLPSGNVDWTEGFRYRGIASGGGASLSLLIPVSIVLCLHLYSEKYLGVFSLIAYVFILIFSVFFIGRTGLILLPLVIIFYVSFNLKRYLFKTAFSFFVISLFLFFYFDELKQVLINQYGASFYHYSLGFLLSGTDGIEGEGTVGIVIEFLSIMPKTFPEVLIGYGFYGGSEFEPWTDSGYSRMFLSVGYLFGAMFYFLFFLMFRGVFFYKPFLFTTIGALLLIAEAKEPLLFTGYSARLYVLVLVLGLLDKKRMKQDNIRTRRSAVEVPSAKVAS
ncbi:hypothetical protein [Marinobacter apostichopi]|uniref:hypothetical protein n=1 Tax=Marinobacter apostichopi TaxID=3035454 RepID=UPI002573B661|nr:hypothetical protein [Marinobacter sp. LA51]